MDIEILFIEESQCRKCKSKRIVETTFSEIHGHRYACNDCSFAWWGGRLKNKEKNEKRPNCPTPKDLGISNCQICMLESDSLGYSERLETHHIDDEPTNNNKSNLMVVCTSCHSLIHHERVYRYQHFMRIKNNE